MVKPRMIKSTPMARGRPSYFNTALPKREPKLTGKKAHVQENVVG